MNIVTMTRLKQSLALFLGIGLMLAGMSARAGQVVTYVHTDRLGNPVAKTDSTGDVIWRQSYTPYGETDRQPDPDGPGYTGHRHDAGTGLVYMQARYYDPKIGRFLSPDPVTFTPDQPQFFNRYWYAQGNPYKYTDPDGRCPICVPGLVPIPGVVGIGSTQTKQGKKATAQAINAIKKGIKTAASKILIHNLKEAGMLSETNEGDESVSDTDSAKPPTTGKPNSTIRGKKQTRRYGADGKPKTDVEYGHQGEGGNPKELHSHDWKPTKEGLGKRGGQRPHDPKKDPPAPKGFDE